MNNIKEPMTGSYTGVFIFTIVMTIFVFFMGAVSGSKGHLGTLIWGYTAWLMYKRKNSQLVSLYKALLWFAGFAAILMIFLFASYGETLGYSGVDLFFLFLLVFVIDYSLLKFFQRQVQIELLPVREFNTKPSDVTTPTLTNEQIWERASMELKNNRREGLWAKCFADVNGDENKAKASYLKIRVNDYLSEGNSTTSNSDDTAKTLVDKKYYLGNEIEKDATVNYSIYSVGELFQKRMFNVKNTLFGELIFLHNGYVCKEVGQHIKCFTSEGLCIEAIRNESINKNFTNGVVLMLDKETFEPY